jgi:branched-chain amino acid aminotransferase
VLHGTGTFTTLRSDEGRVFGLEAHHARLAEGCRRLMLDAPTPGEFHEALRAVAAAGGNGRQRLRFSVLAGPERTHWLAQAAPTSPAGNATVVCTAFRRAWPCPLAGIKPTAYAANLVLQRMAQAAGATEALVLGPDGSLAEGAMSNLFIVRGERVLTPPLSSGCLPGVTRAAVLEICQEDGLAAAEATFLPADLRAADEVFLTSSVRGIQPVGVAGPITSQLIEALAARVARESVVL